VSFYISTRPPPILSSACRRRTTAPRSTLATTRGVSSPGKLTRSRKGSLRGPTLSTWTRCGGGPVSAVGLLLEKPEGSACLACWPSTPPPPPSPRPARVCRTRRRCSRRPAHALLTRRARKRSGAHASACSTMQSAWRPSPSSANSRCVLACCPRQAPRTQGACLRVRLTAP
jgi:hypothetical protein